MYEERNEESVSPAQVLQSYVQSIDDGEVRRELADDCIISLLGHSVKGGTAVTGYVRTQLTSRYKHTSFETVRSCNELEESVLKKRFAKSFKARRTNLKETPKDLPASLHLRAESDNEDGNVDANADSGSKCTSQLVTPPRPTMNANSMDSLRYITSNGILEAFNYDEHDGGIDLGQSCQMTLTLGYRYNSIQYKNTVYISLIVYEKLKSRLAATHIRSRTRLLGLQSHSHTVLTDDEGEVSAPRNVRRMLFTSGDSHDPDETIEHTLPIDNPPALTPRKRQHKSYSNVKFKRSMASGGMRF